MAKYITYNQVVARYERISDIGSPTDISSTYIDFAEAEIESLLSSQFSVPFASNNMTVQDLCIDTTLYKALAYKDSAKSKSIKSTVDSRVKMLLDGTARMVTDSGDALSSDLNAAWSETENYTPVFGKGDIEDFKVDSSQLYNEEQARD